MSFIDEFSPDGMSQSDLKEALQNLTEELEGETIERQEVINSLRDYVRLKIDAMKYREQGSINAALALEITCDRIYNRLPKWARW